MASNRPLDEAKMNGCDSTAGCSFRVELQIIRKWYKTIQNGIIMNLDPLILWHEHKVIFFKFSPSILNLSSSWISKH